MYQRFFGFKDHPFQITPNPRYLYLSPGHQEALAHLRYGIEQRKGFIVLTGEVGCGKTILSRTLLNSLDEKRYDTVLIFNPQLSEKQLLRTILIELEEPKESLVAGVNLADTLYNVLLKRVQKGKQILMILDEAQDLSAELLEQIRLLSNLETDSQKLIQIILLGQPEFKVKINQRNLRQFKQRILVYYELKPLSRRQCSDYIRYRLSLVSTQSNLPRFSFWALRKIFNYTRGIPRLINHVCDKALLSAFSRLSIKVSRADISRAIADIKRLDI